MEGRAVGAEGRKARPGTAALCPGGRIVPMSLGASRPSGRDFHDPGRSVTGSPAKADRGRQHLPDPTALFDNWQGTAAAVSKAAAVPLPSGRERGTGILACVSGGVPEWDK